MHFNILLFLSFLLEGTVTIGFLTFVLKNKYSYLKTFLILLVTILASGILAYPLMTTILKPIIMFTIIFIVMKLISYSSKKDILIFIIVCAILNFFTAYCVKLTYGTLTSFDYSNGLSNSVQRSIAFLFGDIIYLTSSIIFVLFWNKILTTIKSFFLLLIIILPASQLILLFGIYFNNYNNLNENILQYGLICVSVSVIVDILIFILIKRQSAIAKAEKELEIKNLQSNFEFTYYKLATETKEELFKINHDIKNQLQTAYALLDSSTNNIQAKAIVDNINTKLNNLDTIYYSDNEILNTIITIKSKELKDFNIDHTIKVDSLINSNIEDIDICSAFTNLFDNAIECIKKNINKDKNFIRIIITNKSGYLIAKFSNWCDIDLPTKSTHKFTSKENKLYHGYGLNILKDIAIKYDGNFNTKIDNNIFEATLTLRISE